MTTIPNISPFNYLRWNTAHMTLEVVAPEICRTPVTLFAVDDVVVSEIVTTAVAIDGPEAMTRELASRFPLYVFAAATRRGVPHCFPMTRRARATVLRSGAVKVESWAVVADEEKYMASVRFDKQRLAASAAAHGSGAVQPTGNPLPPATVPPPSHPSPAVVLTSVTAGSGPAAAGQGASSALGAPAFVLNSSATPSFVPASDGSQWLPTGAFLGLTSPLPGSGALPPSSAVPSQPVQQAQRLPPPPPPPPPSSPSLMSPSHQQHPQHLPSVSSSLLFLPPQQQVAALSVPQQHPSLFPAARSPPVPQRRPSYPRSASREERRRQRAQHEMQLAAAEQDRNILASEFSRPVTHPPAINISPFTFLRYDSAAHRILVYSVEVANMHSFLLSIDGVKAEDIISLAIRTSPERLRTHLAEDFPKYVLQIATDSGFPCFASTRRATVTVEKFRLERTRTERPTRTFWAVADRSRYEEARRQEALVNEGMSKYVAGQRETSSLLGQSLSFRQSSSSITAEEVDLSLRTTSRGEDALPFTYVTYEPESRSLWVQMPEVAESPVELLSVNFIDTMSIVNHAIASHGANAFNSAWVGHLPQYLAQLAHIAPRFSFEPNGWALVDVRHASTLTTEFYLIPSTTQRLEMAAKFAAMEHAQLAAAYAAVTLEDDPAKLLSQSSDSSSRTNPPTDTSNTAEGNSLTSAPTEKPATASTPHTDPGRIGSQRSSTSSSSSSEGGEPCTGTTPAPLPGFVVTSAETRETPAATTPTALFSTDASTPTTAATPTAAPATAAPAADRQILTDPKTGKCVVSPFVDIWYDRVADKLYGKAPSFGCGDSFVTIHSIDGIHTSDFLYFVFSRYRAAALRKNFARNFPTFFRELPKADPSKSFTQTGSATVVFIPPNKTNRSKGTVVRADIPRYRRCLLREVEREARERVREQLAHTATLESRSLLQVPHPSISGPDDTAQVQASTESTPSSAAKGATMPANAKPQQRTPSAETGVHVSVGARVSSNLTGGTGHGEGSSVTSSPKGTSAGSGAALSTSVSPSSRLCGITWPEDDGADEDGDVVHLLSEKKHHTLLPTPVSVEQHGATRSPVPAGATADRRTSLPSVASALSSTSLSSLPAVHTTAQTPVSGNSAGNTQATAALRMLHTQMRTAITQAAEHGGLDAAEVRAAYERALVRSFHIPTTVMQLLVAVGRSDSVRSLLSE